MFKLISEDGSARAGELRTEHGTVKTPCFMPVATKATAKFVSSRELVEVGTEAIISNAYLLSLKPGTDVITDAGGLHSFMDFKRTIFTDCGGFQMLREGIFIATKPDGIVFKNPYTGERQKLTPADIMRIQSELGSDVAMALDYVPPAGAKLSELKAGITLTNKWHEESLKSKGKNQVFAIVHGGVNPKLRESHAKHLASMEFDGYALGGLCIGEPTKEMLPAVEAAVNVLPEDKTRYLMGVGSPVEILEGIKRGVDFFDSAYPTQIARHNLVLTHEGPIKINNAPYATDMKPLEEGCDCYACTHFTRAYIHFLSRMNEGVGAHLKSLHNLRFLQRLVAESREAIMQGTFQSLLDEIPSTFS